MLKPAHCTTEKQIWVLKSVKRVPVSSLHVQWKGDYIRSLGHRHAHCYAWQKPRGLVVAGVCVLQETKTEKSVRATLQPCEERLMEHLTQSRSQVEPSRSCDTARGRPSWVLRLYRTHIHLAVHLKDQNTPWHEYLSCDFTETKEMFDPWGLQIAFKLFRSTTNTHICYVLLLHVYLFLT